MLTLHIPHTTHYPAGFALKSARIFCLAALLFAGGLAFAQTQAAQTQAAQTQATRTEATQTQPATIRPEAKKLRWEKPAFHPWEKMNNPRTKWAANIKNST